MRARKRSYRRKSRFSFRRKTRYSRGLKKSYLRNRKSTKFTKSLKHTLVINGSKATVDQKNQLSNALILSGVVAETIVIEWDSTFLDLSANSITHRQILSYLRTKHTVNNNTPTISFRGIAIRSAIRSPVALAPLIGLESYPGQGIKAFTILSGKTYIKTLKDENGRTHWPSILYTVNCQLVKLKYYYKLTKPGLKVEDLHDNAAVLLAARDAMQA